MTEAGSLSLIDTKDLFSAFKSSCESILNTADTKQAAILRSDKVGAIMKLLFFPIGKRKQ